MFPQIAAYFITTLSATILLVGVLISNGGQIPAERAGAFQSSIEAAVFERQVARWLGRISTPSKGAISEVWLAEDYDRLRLANEAGDRDGETVARKALERRIRAKLEAQAAALLQAQISNKSVPLLRSMASSGTMRPKKP